MQVNIYPSACLMLHIELFWVKEIDNQMTGNTRFFFTRAELNLLEFLFWIIQIF